MPFQVNQFGQMGGMPGQMNTMPTGMGMGGMGMSPFGTAPMQQQPLQMQMTGANPFRQSMFPQATGAGFLGPQMTGFPGQQQGGTQPFLQPQTTGTGFLQPQTTGFLQPQTTGQMAFQAHRQSTFPGMGMSSSSAGGMEHLSPQPTMQAQPTGFLQPQTTGSNPFRQSTIGTSGSAFLSHPASPVASMGSMGFGSSAPFGEPVRSNSTPIVSNNLTSSPKALVPQKTGSNNPFAPPGGIPSPPPAVPKLPSMNELAQNRMNQQFGMGMGQQQHQHQHQHQPQQQQAASSSTASWDPFAPTTNGSVPGANSSSSAMSDIASAFAIDSKPANNDFASQFSSLNIGGGNTLSTSPGSLQPQSTGFLQPQRTGFGGSSVKPFKPTSSFGSTLMETLPTIPEPASSPGVPNGNSNGVSPQPFGNGHVNQGTGSGPSSVANSPSPFNNTPFSTSFGNALSAPQLTSQPTGFQPTSSFGQNLVAANPAPLQPQTTGSNPFRASMMFGAGGAMGAQPTGQNLGVGVGSPFSPFGQQIGQQKSTQASLLG